MKPSVRHPLLISSALAAAVMTCFPAAAQDSAAPSAPASAAPQPGQAAPSVPPAGDKMVGTLPTQVQGLMVQEHLGAKLPMELQFETFDGRTVSLGDYFPAATGKIEPGKLPKPAIIQIGYFSCPVVCPVVQDKMVEALDKVDLTLGKDYNFLSFSFDPADSAVVAKGARGRALEGYPRGTDPAVSEGFAFHAGNVEATRLLANALGFPYRKVENGQYSHPVALFVISPEGTITRYIYGFDYPPTQIKLALLDASQGKLSKSLGDYFMNYCYRYDPRAGKYTVEAMQVMKLGGALTVVAVAALIAFLRLSEYMRKRQAVRGAAQPSGTDGGSRGGRSAGGPTVTGPVA